MKVLRDDAFACEKINHQELLVFSFLLLYYQQEDNSCIRLQIEIINNQGRFSFDWFTWWLSLSCSKHSHGLIFFFCSSNSLWALLESSSLSKRMKQTCYYLTDLESSCLGGDMLASWWTRLTLQEIYSIDWANTFYKHVTRMKSCSSSGEISSRWSFLSHNGFYWDEEWMNSRTLVTRTLSRINAALVENTQIIVLSIALVLEWSPTLHGQFHLTMSF